MSWYYIKDGDPKLNDLTKPFEIHISRINDHYHFIIEDPANPIASFSEKIPIPSVSRERIFKKLREFLTRVGILRGHVEMLQKEVAAYDSLEKLGRLIFKYMVPATCLSLIHI